MFDIGWTEMLVIAVVMIVVVGPKDLPKMLRTFGKTTTKLRSMAGDFQKQFNEALKEAELDDIKKSVDSLKGLNPATEIKKQLNPFEKVASDVRAGLDAAMKPKPAAAPAAVAAEPLKNGAISETPSSTMPAVPVPAARASAASPDPAAPPPAQPVAAPAAVAVAAVPPVTKAGRSKAAPKAAAKAAAKPAGAKAKAAPRKKPESSAQ
ncbi:Sec-independent protein translocase protein TatB [Mesorhizobium sp. KR9-304]|uniref:Sec-independent protein translocase protein TatB n=1 Tax=Mesorhizobium sp. KR9-304 TaxID=3156614 RepID=UPI0032B5D7D8